MAKMAGEDFARLLRIIRDEDFATVRVGDTVCKFDPADQELIAQHQWRHQRSFRTAYAVTKINGRVIQMHRLLLNPPGGMVVDHIDGDGLNNQRHNLRVCTMAENTRNRHSTSGKSRFKGVHFDGGAWRAQIQVERRRIQLGSFASEEKAARAYDRAAIRHHGEFACTNSDLGLYQRLVA